jgi:glycosyltransferase involved in cell wall biosynthesis
MRIGIDISLSVGEKTGVGYYTANLVDALAKIDKTNEYLLYPFFYHMYRSDLKTAVAPRQKNFHLHYEKIPKPIIDMLWYSPIPKKWILGNVDILHSTTFSAPQHHYGKLIVTIYDVSFLTLPECHTEANREHCLKGTLDAVKYANRIIAISNHGKQELVKYFNADPDKIVVTHLAAKDIFAPCTMEEQNRVCEKYGIPRDFILSVRSSDPRKNIGMLIRAYRNLPENVKNQHPLVMAGGKGGSNSDLGALTEPNTPDRIRYIGYVDEQDLPALYSAAAVFVYPSLYEGFGLPILEAMSCGAPVITSNTSSMPEVSGDAALLIDPTDVSQLTTKILELMGNDALRKELSWKGIERAGQFSWEKTARTTLKIYEELNYG